MFDFWTVSGPARFSSRNRPGGPDLSSHLLGMTNRPGFSRLFRRSGSRGSARIFGQVFRRSGLPLLFHTRAHMRSRIFRRNTLLARVADWPGFRLVVFRPLAVGTLPSRGLWSSGFRDVVERVRRISQASARSSGSGEGPGVFRRSSRSPERLRVMTLLGSPAR